MLIDILCSHLTVIVIGFFKANIILKQNISILPSYLYTGQDSAVKYSIRVSCSSCITEHTMGINQRSTQGLYYLLENVPWMQIATVSLSVLDSLLWEPLPLLAAQKGIERKGKSPSGFNTALCLWDTSWLKIGLSFLEIVQPYSIEHNLKGMISSGCPPICLTFICTSHSCECNISRTPKGNFLKQEQSFSWTQG